MYHNLHSPSEHRRRRWRRIRVAAALAACAFFASLCSFQARCAGIRREVLRLHVIANSDSDLDQRAKLYVRDELLRAGAALFDGSINAASAEAAIAPRVPELERCAQKALLAFGLNYPVRVEVGEDYFPTRVYEEAGVTLPAGRYQAVRVILGGGEGRNWWCVMFPPLCLPAARARRPVALDALFTGGQLRVLRSNPKVEIRFKIVELWEGLLERLRQS
ncbi:MAG: stage II sporulation protein R [Oscillospiraceae bacterium]|jgi:stage II sporulation protein R|nr:stage II sporulation protein R [Oscillospiraceae bacterium]